MAGSARMDGGDVVSAEEFAAMFAALPTAYLVMSPDLTIVEANPAYLTLLGRTRGDLIGRYVFDAFPPGPETLDETGENPLQLSFERARDTGMPDHMPLFRYEVADQATGRPVQRAWSLISAPVLGPDGRTRLVLQRVEDVSEYLVERERLAESRDDGGWARLDLLEADLFARTQELQAALASREANQLALNSDAPTQPCDMPMRGGPQHKRLRFEGAQVCGRLAEIECAEPGVVFRVETASGATLRLRAEDMRRVRFVTYTAQVKTGTVSCGPRERADHVLITYRSPRDPQQPFDGEAVAVEFIPEDRNPCTEMMNDE